LSLYLRLKKKLYYELQDIDLKVRLMLVGYARVSRPEQSLNLQIDALKQAGCERIFSDTVSGAKAERQGLDEALAYLRAGDVLVCWKLDRLGRSLKHLIELANELDGRGIGLKSLQENIDTTTAGGRLIFHLFGALAEFEREIIRERTNAGLAAARARGRKGGRRIAHSDKKIATAQKLADTSNDTIAQICESLGISRSTYYRRLHKN
jgi:DNA invertase Pin-like site-specific DNA recombinase